MRSSQLLRRAPFLPPSPATSMATRLSLSTEDEDDDGGSNEVGRFVYGSEPSSTSSSESKPFSFSSSSSSSSSLDLDETVADQGLEQSEPRTYPLSCLFFVFFML